MIHNLSCQLRNFSSVDLALPDDKRLPTSQSQRGLHTMVAFYVRIKLGIPKLNI